MQVKRDFSGNVVYIRALLTFLYQPVDSGEHLVDMTSVRVKDRGSGKGGKYRKILY